jgi:hypothetical protein
MPLCAPQKVPHQSSEVPKKGENKLVDRGSGKWMVLVLLLELNLEMTPCAHHKKCHSKALRKENNLADQGSRKWMVL